MSVPFVGFVGNSYESETKYASIERTVNFFYGPIEDPAETKTRESLFPSPCNAVFGPIPSAYPYPARGRFEYRGTVYCVNGSIFFTIDQNGNESAPLASEIVDDGKPVCFTANGNGQVVFSSGGNLYVWGPGNGTVNTNGTAVTFVSGDVFKYGQWASGDVITINGSNYTISSVSSDSRNLTLNKSAGVQSDVTYNYPKSYFTVLIAGENDGNTFLGASSITFQDGYILVVTPNSNQFQISGNNEIPVGDANLWDAANVSIQLGQADYLSAIISNQEYVYLIGNRRSQIYNNVGANGIGGFPFQTYNDTFLEMGSPSPFTICPIGNIASEVIAGVSQSNNGSYQAFAFEGLHVTRISNFAVEQAWSKYPRVDDAVAFSYQWKGHLMWQVSFPSANDGLGATWVYDRTVSTMLGRPCWHERTYTDFQGNSRMRSEQSHCFAFGKHLVGSTGVDGNPGVTYQYADRPYCDQGVNSQGVSGNRAMVRQRVCPHIWESNKWMIFDRIEFSMAYGQGLDGDIAALGANPVLLLSWSNDGGQTFGTEYEIPVGKMGQFSLRVLMNRTGKARDRVFKVVCSDPIYWEFNSANLDVRLLGV